MRADPQRSALSVFRYFSVIFAAKTKINCDFVWWFGGFFVPSHPLCVIANAKNLKQ